MSDFGSRSFVKFEFTDQQCRRYLENARRDWNIAKQDSIAEVRFTYAYQALLKAGIALIAKTQSLKVRSISGHHVAVISKMSEILNNDDINTIGHRMRKKRNKDLYDGGDIISAKEADDCLQFVESIISEIVERFGK